MHDDILQPHGVDLNMQNHVFSFTNEMEFEIGGGEPNNIKGCIWPYNRGSLIFKTSYRVKDSLVWKMPIK